VAETSEASTYRDRIRHGHSRSTLHPEAINFRALDPISRVSRSARKRVESLPAILQRESIPCLQRDLQILQRFRLRRQSALAGSNFGLRSWTLLRKLVHNLAEERFACAAEELEDAWDKLFDHGFKHDVVRQLRLTRGDVDSAGEALPVHRVWRWIAVAAFGKVAEGEGSETCRQASDRAEVLFAWLFLYAYAEDLWTAEMVLSPEKVDERVPVPLVVGLGEDLGGENAKWIGVLDIGPCALDKLADHAFREVVEQI
jgi:hypothetical protein